VRLTRDVGNVNMDLADVEALGVKALGGTDTLTVEDLTGTGVASVLADLAANSGGDDFQIDNVVVHATPGDDVMTVTGAGPNTQLDGLAARIAVSGASPSADRLTIHALAGDDVIDASGQAAVAMLLTLDGGDDDDVLIGGDGPDVLLGGLGDDVLLGGPGVDAIDGGPGDNIVIGGFAGNTVTSATAATETWLRTHASSARGKAVIEVGGEKRKLPRASLGTITRAARSA
jgi:Ca2+-binding RTX toxin-like protein